MVNLEIEYIIVGSLLCIIILLCSICVLIVVVSSKRDVLRNEIELLIAPMVRTQEKQGDSIKRIERTINLAEHNKVSNSVDNQIKDMYNKVALLSNALEFIFESKKDNDKKRESKK